MSRELNVIAGDDRPNPYYRIEITHSSCSNYYKTFDLCLKQQKLWSEGNLDNCNDIRNYFNRCMEDTYTKTNIQKYIDSRYKNS